MYCIQYAIVFHRYAPKILHIFNKFLNDYAKTHKLDVRQDKRIRRLRMDTSSNEIRDLAIELTNIRSIVGTTGEVAISDWIYKRLSANGYFVRYPKNLFWAPVPSDPLGRKCVIACLEPDKSSSGAILCLGHTDTVGISDFAGNVDIATDPEALFETYSRAGL